ncbi:MAG: flagellin lysine-N-methylase, partial [Dorea longicatena]|nr:flagellin lysine-N-methylase [Dorea longicatena]
RNQYLMERLRDDWEPHLLEAESLLYGDIGCSDSEEQCTKYKEQYTKNKQEFHTWLNTHMPDYEIWYEQLLAYFISTYFCGAVYDGEAYVKVQMAVVSVLLIHELLMAQWLKNEKMLEMEDVVDTVYRYSRELEHSDPNLNLMEKLMRRDLLSWFKKDE